MSNEYLQEIKAWSKHALEKPLDYFNGLPPCPYAEKAWEDNRQKESELVQSLTEKYGPGSLNPQTGEYTPVSVQETENN